MLIFYGKRKTLAGSFEAFMYECPHCAENNSTTIAVYSWYFHIFWIPVLPLEKEGYAVCSSCTVNRSEMRFGPKLLAEYKEKKGTIRHPWWTWAWPILIMVLFAAILIDSVN